MKIQTLILPAILAVGIVAAGSIWLWERSRPTVPEPYPASVPSSATVAPNAERRILYYRNPMGLADTSPIPKQDAMGMAYVPVYAGEEGNGNAVAIGIDKVQKLGVKSEPAALRVLSRTLRIVGTVQSDERRQSAITPRFEGWITRLFVSTTGETVRRGQPLLEVYSPDLLSAQQDYTIASKALASLDGAGEAAQANMRALVQSSLQRLANWDISPADLPPLRDGEPASQNFVLRAPRDGVVTEKMARVGLRFMPGEPLYQIVDLSSVWLVGNVFEQDMGLVHTGMPVQASFVAYPGRRFPGAVSFISPMLQADTRTAQIRVDLRNPHGLLKPGMYGSVEVSAGSSTERLSVPDSAVLDTGTRQLVLVDRGGGQFEPRTVELGMQGDGYVEILSGITQGEAIVVNGNFLIDAESNLRAAVGGSAHAHAGASKSVDSAPEAPVASPNDTHANHGVH
jgi:Cu(I)/Ag(I) efflux system membrane fusion protein